MKMPRYNDTITAIATPPGLGAIGIVRLSGPESRAVFKHLWISSTTSVDKMETHRFYYGKVAFSGVENGRLSPDIPSSSAPINNQPHSGVEGEGATQTPIIDEVMAVFFAGPRSYTGEDMVEIYCHGGPVVVREVLAACVATGARLAEPGEFTRRAFLNGKMDLAQAEAVAGVIHATSESARRNATDQLSGRLSTVISRAMESLTELRAFVEATIDFPEEDIEMIAHAGIKERLTPIRGHLMQLSATYATGRLLSDGARVVLVGAPNVGKSSLMNALLGHDRSIVHDVPGTTRDYVDAVWNLNGIAVHLTDTAGLRQTGVIPAVGTIDSGEPEELGPRVSIAPSGQHCGDDELDIVERIGIARSLEKMDEADVVLMVCDGSRELREDEAAQMSQLDPARSVVVVNKGDLLTSKTATWHPIPGRTVVSARTGEGLDVVQAALLKKLQGDGPQEIEGVTISALRHRQALDRAVAALTAAEESVAAKESAEFVAHHLTQASSALGEIVGEVTTDDVLGQIFGKFCIGK